MRSGVPTSLVNEFGHNVNTLFDHQQIKHSFGDPEYRNFLGEKSSLYDLAGSGLLQNDLNSVYANRAWRTCFATARRVAAPDTTSVTYQDPLQIHVDGMFHMLEFTVNFCVPFQECGVDAPSLQILPLDFKTTREFTGFTLTEQRSGESNNLDIFDPQTRCFQKRRWFAISARNGFIGLRFGLAMLSSPRTGFYTEVIRRPR